MTNLLDMSRIQAAALSPMLRPVRVEDVLYAAVASLGSVGSLVTIDIADSLPLVQADGGLLERALANVIDNAVTWSPPATPVRVEAGVAGSRIDVRVIDQGPGVPRDQRDAIFVRGAAWARTSPRSHLPAPLWQAWWTPFRTSAR